MAGARGGRIVGRVRLTKNQVKVLVPPSASSNLALPAVPLGKSLRWSIN